MKKFFLLLAAVSISMGAIAQKGKVTSAQSFIDQGALDKAKEALDQAFTNEKSKDWFNTYFVKGKLCNAIYEADNPKYNSFYPDPLQEAYTAYEKAIELDAKGSTKKKIITQMIYNTLAMNLYAQGSKKFDAKDYEGALNSFTTQIKITESDKYAGGLDTGMYYNAGLAAINCKKFDQAIKYFEKCGELKYLGITPYYQIYECFMGQGDTVKAEQYLLDLPKKFPGDNTITLSLADLYLKSNRSEEALKYIKIAKESDPNNEGLYFAAGVTLLKKESFDEAIVELSRACELKPDGAGYQYSLGVAYINKAAAMFLKANDIMDVAKYTKAIEEANAVYAKALPYMQKAVEQDPNDVYSLRLLKELYYRLKMTKEYDEVKAKLDTLEQK
jgi:tetratricopeptide (TPR) repeat protein